MADGLLSNVLGAIDRKKQEVKAGLGLLANNPQEWAAQATARYFPTKEEERQFRMVKEMGGDITQTPYYQKVFDLTQFQGSIKPKGLLNAGGLPSPQSLAMPDVPTVEQMKQYGRVETVPLSKAVSFQSARNWEKFNAGKSPGDLVAGYGDKPLALRLETGEYVIYDGNHRTDLALQKGKTEMPMHVIDVKSYDPAHAGRKPVPDKMSADELLKMLLGN
jgi:hypothetical protein